MPCTCTSITRIQQTEPTLITKDNRVPFHSLVDSFMTPVLLQANGSQWSWWHSRCNMFLDFFPGCCSGGHYCSQCVNLDVCLYYVAIQNLIYGCGNVPQTTAECSDTPLMLWCPTCAAIHWYALQLPAGLQFDPVQMAEVVQQEYVLFVGAWLYTRVNVANTVTACRVKTEGTKTVLLSAIWSQMTVANESLMLLPLNKHILYHGANEHSPWKCCIFFFPAVYIFNAHMYKMYN